MFGAGRVHSCPSFICMGCVSGQASSNKPVIAMNSRPLLDYLIDAAQGGAPDTPAPDERLVDSMEARLRDMAAKLRDQQPATRDQQHVAREQPDLTLSAQIEAILKRKGQVERAQQIAGRLSEEPVRAARTVVEPPPMQMAPAGTETAYDTDFSQVQRGRLPDWPGREALHRPAAASPGQVS